MKRLILLWIVMEILIWCGAFGYLYLSIPIFLLFLGQYYKINKRIICRFSPEMKREGYLAELEMFFLVMAMCCLIGGVGIWHTSHRYALVSWFHSVTFLATAWAFTYRYAVDLSDSLT